MSILKHDTKLGCATIVSNDILGIGKVVPGDIFFPKFIVIDNSDILDMTAMDLHNTQKLQNKLGEKQNSWHFSVDDKNIVQSIDSYWLTLNTGNPLDDRESISIKICQFKDKARAKLAEYNVIALIHELAKVHVLDVINCIKKHEDYSCKSQPEVILSSENSWSEFLERVYHYDPNDNKAHSDFFSNISKDIDDTKDTMIFNEKIYLTDKKILVKHICWALLGCIAFSMFYIFINPKIDGSVITIFILFEIIFVAFSAFQFSSVSNNKIYISESGIGFKSIGSDVPDLTYNWNTIELISIGEVQVDTRNTATFYGIQIFYTETSSYGSNLTFESFSVKHLINYEELLEDVIKMCKKHDVKYKDYRKK